MLGNNLISAVGNQCAAMWKLAVTDRSSGDVEVPNVWLALFNVRKGNKKKKKKKKSTKQAIAPRFIAVDRWRKPSALYNTYCNWLHATMRAFPTMYTVGMIMPSVKLYQPKPNGKQVCIILQTNTERNLYKICDRHNSWSLLSNK